MLEIMLRPGDLPLGGNKAFVNVVTWANSSDMAKEKVTHCLQSYGWYIISVETIYPVDEDKIYGEDIENIVDQARDNPRAVIYGRMFSYKEE